MKSKIRRIGMTLFLSVALVFSVFSPASAQDSGTVGSPAAPGTAVDAGLTGDEILAEIQAAAAAAAAAQAAAAPAAAPADEVLGVSVTSADQLAFTGGSVNTPLAVGSIMIGAGGLILIAARKREQG